MSTWSKRCLFAFWILPPLGNFYPPLLDCLLWRALVVLNGQTLEGLKQNKQMPKQTNRTFIPVFCTIFIICNECCCSSLKSGYTFTSGFFCLGIINKSCPTIFEPPSHPNVQYLAYNVRFLWVKFQTPHPPLKLMDAPLRILMGLVRRLEKTWKL